MIVSIIGNIASGKSTIIQEMMDVGRGETFEFAQEPIDAWSLFEEFNKNMSKYSFPFSMEVLRSFSSMSFRADKTYIVERNPLDTVHVFGSVLQKNGSLTAEDLDLMTRYSETFGWKPDKIVYIETPASICFDRIETRGRESESNLSYEYIRALEFSYETALKSVYSEVPMLRIRHTDDDKIGRILRFCGKK